MKGNSGFIKSMVVTVLSLIFVGCATSISPVVNTSPIEEIDFSKSYQTAESCINQVLFFPAVGEASVMQAAKTAGIQKVVFVDQKYHNYILGSKTCIKVYGN